MRKGYFAEQEELIEDMEKYNEKLDQLYVGIQLLHKDPEKSADLINDSLEYFEEFSEKHNNNKKDRKTSIDLDETREHLENILDSDFRDRFNNLRDFDISNYDFGFSKGKNKDRDKGGGSTITWYDWGEDFEPVDMDDLFDLAEEVTNYGTGSGSSQGSSDQDAFNDFVDNDLDMSEFKDYTE